MQNPCRRRFKHRINQEECELIQVKISFYFEQIFAFKNFFNKTENSHCQASSPSITYIILTTILTNFLYLNVHFPITEPPLPFQSFQTFISKTLFPLCWRLTLSLNFFSFVPPNIVSSCNLVSFCCVHSSIQFESKDSCSYCPNQRSVLVGCLSKGTYQICFHYVVIKAQVLSFPTVS